MRLDFAPIGNGEQTIAEFSAPVTLQDLRETTDALVDEQRRILAEIVDADVVFVPVDPDAEDPGAGEEAALPWTLGHVVVHATAGSEEGAAAALTLARGAPLEGRPRYETPWERMQTVEQVVQRLEESRRMRLAMLSAWPDEPNLDQTVLLVERFGPLNAVGRYVLGLMHEDSHLAQLAEIVRQAGAARAA